MFEEGIQYLRDLVMVVTYSNLNNKQASKDLDEVLYFQSMWQKLVWNTPMLCTSTLVIIGKH